MKTKQIVFTKPDTAELTDTVISDPGTGEVTVKIAYSAISAGTERANITGDKNIHIGAPSAQAVFPRVLGYSASGIITGTGTGVTSKIGERVVVYWGRHTADITVGEHSHIVKIEDDRISLAEASLAMIATFPLAAVRKIQPEIGESSLVMGLGILGLFAVQLCKTAGCCPVIAADPIAQRRTLALELGADFVFDPSEPDFPANVRTLSRGGVQTAVEVTGRGEGFVQALDCMAKMGRIALLGCTRDPNFTVDYYRKIHGPGISVIGAHTLARPSEESYPGHWTHRDDIAALLRLLSGGRLNFGALISEVHSPHEAPEVYGRLVRNELPVGVLFDWSSL